MYKLVFRIRKCYFDEIVLGNKVEEIRPDTPFWRVRVKNLTLPAMAVFVCGKRVHRREVHSWAKTNTPNIMSEQGKKDIPTPECFRFFLGKSLDGGEE